VPTKKPETLALYEPFTSPALAASHEEMSETLDIIRGNLGENGGIGVSDLDRLRVPNGSKSFLVPTLEGDDTVSEITGIVLLARTNRAFWSTKTISDSPPDCSSSDGVAGVGSPGGSCATCPLAQFGSAAQYVEGGGERAQACKQSVALFLLTEDNFLPKLLQLPPTSLRDWRKYLVALTGRRLHHLEVLTTFGVELEKNATGQQFSKVVPRFGGRLDEATKAQVRSYAEGILPYLNTVRATPAVDLGVEA
jgi:hypothetical protein